MQRLSLVLMALVWMCSACNLPVSAQPVANVTSTQTLRPADTIAPLILAPTYTLTIAPSATVAFTETPSPTLTDTPTSTNTPLLTVTSLRAQVSADLLSCRYGPGAPYLYLYALRRTANIKLIGRAGYSHWVYVDGKNKCWVNANYLDVAGDINSLPDVYPSLVYLPITEYYPKVYQTPAILSVVRKGNQITLEWSDVPLVPGDEEDAEMQHYIVEVWHCMNGQFIFEPLATNYLEMTFEDDAGCEIPSHGRVIVQEKHGFTPPAEIPWPPMP